MTTSAKISGERSARPGFDTRKWVARLLGDEAADLYGKGEAAIHAYNKEILRISNAIENAQNNTSRVRRGVRFPHKDR